MFLKVPNKIFQGPKKIFIRPQWIKFADLLLDRTKPIDSAVLTGNPGIGKSLFAIYFIWRWITTFAGQTIYIYSSRGNYLFKNGITYVIGENDPYSSDGKPNTLVIVDGRSPPPPGKSVPSLVLLTCSPKKDHWHRFSKDVSAKVYFMPIWRLPELETLRKISFPNVTREQLDEQFKYFGGIPRFCLWDLTNPKTLDMSVSRIDFSQITQIIGNATDGFEAPHSIIHIETEGHQIVPNGHQKAKISTDFVAEKLVSQHIIVQRDKIASIIRSGNQGVLGALRGYLFEPYLHNILSSGKSTFRKRVLGWTRTNEDCEWQNDIKNEVLEHEISMGHDQRKTFTNYDDILNDEHPKAYWQPTSTNEKSIDGFLYPDTFIQSTVSKTHSLFADVVVNMTKLAVEQLGQKYFYFMVVVTADRFETFQKGPISPLTADGKKGKENLSMIEKVAMERCLQILVAPM
eukprot:TRINITY_DN46_c0_g1_i2.p1 TRINITY_DN46_c0_g1~~TRINITY_DN46_c0_g1_i2.p1  ORF type:complete len:459 (-),score=59.80 TRINITY_DN46_c0_g1_i2:96-1472(-)